MKQVALMCNKRKVTDRLRSIIYLILFYFVFFFFLLLLPLFGQIIIFNCFFISLLFAQNKHSCRDKENRLEETQVGYWSKGRV